LPAREVHPRRGAHRAHFLQRLSGTATLTRAFVDRVRGTRAGIYDTRKTTPGLRILEKAAVRAGAARTTGWASTTWP